ncbi:MAG: mechanosensitive ion channel family protein [Symploca sp. SIO2E6]|nr:mechanosensitive ion channel family protein [Symploca sp. SIO2E6]
MNKFLEILKYALPFALILSGFSLGLLFERRGFNLLKKIGKKTGWEGYSIIIRALRGMVLLWFVVAGVFAATLSFPINTSLLEVIQKALLAVVLASVTLVVSKLAVSFIELYSNRGEEGSPLTSLFEIFTRLIIFSLGLLIIIQSLGIAITPLLTALGIGGVSIGLALQNTLSNLFSGLNILTSKKVRVGDYIKLDTGEEGYVTDIAWRQTIIKEYNENLIVIPNSQLISSNFTNYALPTKEQLITIELGVSYDSDLEQVEMITLAVAKEVMQEVEGGVANFEPFLRFHQFDYFSINLTVYLRVKEFIDHLVVRHEFIKRLRRRYQLEGIELPFPIKVTYVPKKWGIGNWE